MAQDFLPEGTARGNEDAVRTAAIAQAFFLIADVMKGVDDQPRHEPGFNTQDGVLGPTSSYGVDVGVAADGSLYVRGRSGSVQDNSATPNVPPQKVAAKQAIPPLVWLVVGAIALKLIL